MFCATIWWLFVIFARGLQCQSVAVTASHLKCFASFVGAVHLFTALARGRRWGDPSSTGLAHISCFALVGYAKVARSVATYGVYVGLVVC